MNPAIFAHFNGDTIVLDEPFELKTNMRLIVTVLNEENDEREDWRILAKQSLARAFSDNEPEYSLDSIKEVNP